MTRLERSRRIVEITSEIRGYEARVAALRDEREILLRQNDLERFTCPCVRLNRDLGIHDRALLVAQKRSMFGSGRFVADCLSADWECSICGGTGEPGSAKGDGA